MRKRASSLGSRTAYVKAGQQGIDPRRESAHGAVSISIWKDMKGLLHDVMEL